MGVNFIKNRAVFFDRDGIINKSHIIKNKPYPPKNVESTEICDGIFLLLNYLKNNNYFCIVITNQPDIARGTKTIEEDMKINDFLLSNLFINKIYTCYHDNQDNCNCRKPKIGNFLLAKKEFNLDMNNCWMIGDRSSDITAGRKANCKTIFIDYDYDEHKPFRYDAYFKSTKFLLPFFRGLT